MGTDDGETGSSVRPRLAASGESESAMMEDGVDVILKHNTVEWDTGQQKNGSSARPDARDTLSEHTIIAW